MWPVRQLQLNDFLNKFQGCVLYQCETSLDEYRLTRPLKFSISVRKKLKHPNIIEEKQRKALEKQVSKKGINNFYAKEVVPLG